MNRSRQWYAELKKPWFAPPGWIFAPVWTGLYGIIAVTYIYVAYAAITGEVPAVLVVPFILNLVFNLLYTPLQFGLRSLILATIDILLVVATLIIALGNIYPYAPWVALANIPYLLWVCFATVLQCTITAMNKHAWHS